MYNTSLRIVNNSDEAEDVMQESFLTAFDRLDTFREEVSFGAWLKKIVVNKSLDAIKKRKLSFELIEDVEQHLSSDKESEDLTGDEKKQAECVKNAIFKLKDGYRIVLSLYLLEGYDHDEIAEILNITASTSRSQLARAKVRLIKLLKEQKQH